jgi:hypothetical protein
MLYQLLQLELDTLYIKPITSVPASRDAPVARQIVGTSSSSDFKSMNAFKFLFVFVSIVLYTSPEYS